MRDSVFEKAFFHDHFFHVLALLTQATGIIPGLGREILREPKTSVVSKNILHSGTITPRGKISKVERW